MSRLGIDLSATRCHVVQLSRGGTSVEGFETIPYGWSDPAALTGELQRVLPSRRRDRHAGVALWGVRSVQQLLDLPPAKPAELEVLARRELGKDLAALQTTDLSTGVQIAGDRPAPDGSPRNQVAFVAASNPDIRSRIQPLLNAGLTVDSVVTPALALASLAKLRRHGTPGTSAAYLAITDATTVLAIVRDNVLLFSREFGIGYQREGTRTLDQEAFAARLGGELKRSFAYFRQTSRSDVSRVLVAGDMPNLRSLTGPLTGQLEVEVETLDTPDGSGGTQESWLAWAAAVDAKPAADLLPSQVLVEQSVSGMWRPITVGAVAAVLIAALAYWVVDLNARGAERRLADVTDELTTLQPRAAEIQQERQAITLRAARGRTLDAYATQGPRLARALEDLANATAPEVTIESISFQAQDLRWGSNVSGFAVADNVARAQAAVNQLLRAIQDSPYLGVPAPPDLRVVAGRTEEVSDPTPEPLRPRIFEGRNQSDETGERVRVFHLHQPDGPPISVTEDELRAYQQQAERAASPPPPIPFDRSGIEFSVDFDIQR